MTCLVCGSNTIIRSKNMSYCSICLQQLPAIQNRYFTPETTIVYSEFYDGQIENFRQRDAEYFKDKIMTYSNDSDFSHAFNKLRIELYINTFVFENQRWIRDRYFESPNKLYFIQKNTIKVNKTNRPFPPGQYPGHAQTALYPITHHYLSLILKPHGYYDYRNFANTYRFTSYTSQMLNQEHIKETVRPLEGGNFFMAQNIYGETWVIIGENALLNEMDIMRFKTENQKYANFMNWSIENFKQIFEKEILERYRKIFGTSNIIFIPQWTYHIDLLMAFIGKGTFLLHCFDEGEKYWDHYKNDAFFRFTQNGPKFKAFISDQANRLATPSYRKIFTEIKNKLESCDFNVIPFCGCIYQEKSLESKQDQNLDTSLRWFQISRGDCLASFFTNGFNYYSAHTQQHYFITLNSPLPFHKTYLENILRPLKITPIFIDMNHAMPGYSAMRIEKSNLHGAVRCQMNWLSAKMLTQPARQLFEI